MNSIAINRPAILIDQKKSRIRIYRRTLHMLGDPQFIQLLVNPQSLTIAIKAAKRTDPLAHRIVWEKLVHKASCEIYSIHFVRGLQNICEEWKRDESYRLFGCMIQGERIICFDLKNALSISSRMGDHYEETVDN